MAAVEKAGQAEHTITFFTSDNGPWTIEVRRHSLCFRPGWSDDFR